MHTYWFPAAVALGVVLFPPTPQDPVNVDPHHHETVLDNEHVRVMRITLKPGEKTPSHQHPAGVAVLLTDASMRLTGMNVPPDQSPRKAGEVLLTEATTHVVENTGTTTSEVMLVELKPKRPEVGTTMMPKGKGAVEADPTHYKTLAENDRVRVLHVRYGPGEKSQMHAHPALVAIPLTAAQMRMHMPGGKTEDAPAMKKGAAIFDPGTQHTPENIGKGPAELILVELK